MICPISMRVVCYVRTKCTSFALGPGPQVATTQHTGLRNGKIIQRFSKKKNSSLCNFINTSILAALILAFEANSAAASIY